MNKYGGKFNRTDQDFFMKWDTRERRTRFNTEKEGPFSWKERERLSQTMSTRQILDTVEYKEDNQARRNRKWKEIRHFWNITHADKNHRGNIENAFWMYGPDPIPVTQFVMALMKEFKFGYGVELTVENHFRWLYLSLDGGKEGLGDWRELLSGITTINFFRMIKRRPEELLIQLFNIYAEGAHRHKDSRDDMFVAHKLELRRIFDLPVISDYELSSIREMLSEACAHIPPGEPLNRPIFRSLLLNNRPLVKYWTDLLWKHIPADLRLQCLDEIEDELIIAREAKIQQYLWRKAVEHKSFYTYRTVFRSWARVCASTALVTRQVKQLLKRKQRRFFVFWHWHAAYRHQKRRRRLLAEVMGNYTLKARCFARIKLFIYIHRNIQIAVGHHDKNQKVAKEAFARIRWARTKHFMRKALHRWADVAGYAINLEFAAAFCFDKLMTRVFRGWAVVALGSAKQKRSEMMALENQNFLRDMMQEAEDNARLMVELEYQRRKTQEEAEKKAKDEAAAYRLAMARKRAQAEKKQEQSMIALMQRELRRRTVEKQLKKMRRKFDKEWNKKAEQMEASARERAVEYFLDKENIDEVKVRYERLRRAFYAPPSVDNREREKVISSVKNIVFLFLEAKMKENKLKLTDVIPKFDLDGKGYLSYDEFRSIIKSLECNISENQISEVIKGVDTDGDQFIELSELEAAMEPVQQMGVESSPWKFYVDPAQDVICYHNFETGTKVLEHKMTKEIMMEIVKENIKAEYANSSREYAKVERENDWDCRIKEVMAQRIQNMAHLWFGRRLRKKFAWKAEQRKATERSTSKQRIVKFIAKRMRGFKARCRFERQLRCTWEKLWDIDSQKSFWYNHQSTVSQWEKPLMLSRYGDVEDPPPWIAIPPTEDQRFAGVVAVHFWHILGRTTLPKKPDGYTLCQLCQTNIAFRECEDCIEQQQAVTKFCFVCHRASHSSPMDFLQRKRPSKIQRFDTDFMQRLSNSTHRWHLIRPPTCGMCKSTKVLAAHYCENCSLHICRPCCRRTHDVLQHHIVYDV